MHTERVGCENGRIRPRDPGATVDSGAGVSGEEDAVFNIRGKSASETGPTKHRRGEFLPSLTVKWLS